jgi:hypothetical protein
MKIAIITLIAFALSLTLYSFANPNADTLFLNHRGKEFTQFKRTSSVRIV